jgi:tetratricopeptide (TPR) repeat protein
MTSGIEPSRGDNLLSLLEQLDHTENWEQAFIELILKAAARKDPELPDLLRACAIPRRINGQIVGVLRDDPDDEERNQQLLEMVSAHRFVLRRDDGDYVYHDNTRDALLLDWQSSDEKQDEFASINDWLADHYEVIYDEAVQSSQDLNNLAKVMQSANLDRYRRLAALVEARMAIPLLEGLYHRLMADPTEAITLIEGKFFNLETAGQLHLCRSLIRVTRDFLERLPAEQHDTRQFAWLDYFETRIEYQLASYDSARIERSFSEIGERQELDPQLRMWALNELALMYEREMRLDQAARIRWKLLEHVRHRNADIYNEPLYYSNFGILCWNLDDLERAVEPLRIAIERSRDLPDARRDLQVTAGLSLSGVYADLGQWANAFDAAIEALCLARSGFARDVYLQHAVALRFMALLSTFDPRLGDTVAQESLALVPASSYQRLAALRAYVQALRNSGRITAAEDWLTQLKQETAQSDDRLQLQFAYDLQLTQALTLGKRGRRAEADAIYSDLVARTRDSRADRSIFCESLANRALGRASLGNQPSLEADLMAAIEQWEKSGLVRNAASVRAVLANTLGERGRIDEAQQHLDQCAEVLRGTLSTVIDDYYVAQGKALRRHARWQEARAAFIAGLQVSRRRRDLTGQLGILSNLTDIASNQSDWYAAVEYYGEAVAVSARLATIDRYRRSDTDEQADRWNAEGIRVFSSLDDQATDIDQATELLRSACEASEDNCWYHLNISFVYAEQEEWLDAIASLMRALELCPEPMRTPRLYRCWWDYASNHAEVLHQTDGPPDAAEYLRATLERVEPHLPREDLQGMRRMLGDHFVLAGRHVDAQNAYQSASGTDRLDDRGDATDEEPISDRLQQLITDIAEYWNVDDTLRNWIDDAVSASHRDELRALRASLTSYLDEAYGLRRGSSHRYGDADDLEIPVVTPIVLEVGGGLVPIVESYQDGGLFLYELLPAMQQRIVEEFGISVPGLRARSTTGLNSNDYAIQIDEVPRTRGIVHPAMWFLSISRASVSDDRSYEPFADTHPLTDEPGTWVDQAQADLHRDGEGDVVSAAQFLVYQIEATLRQNLDRFFGVQETATLLLKWESEPGSADLIADVLPTPRARLRLTWLLRALLRESVPISDWRSLLQGVRAGGGISAAPADLLRATRLQLCDQLPGNRAGVVHLAVPENYQQLDRDANGRALLAHSSEQKHEFLVWLRGMLRRNHGQVALVTSNGELRPLLSQFVRPEFPKLTVLSEEELIDH